MTILLRRHDLRRRHLRGGELALEYGSQVKVTWTSHIEGYRPGLLAVVSRGDVALPSTLEVCASDAGLDLAEHPLVPRLRALVAEALLSAHRCNAPSLVEEFTGLEVQWAPGSKQSVDASHRRALDAVDAVVRDLANDLGARARRRRSDAIMNGTRTVSVTPEVARLIDPPPPLPSKPAVFTDELLEKMKADVKVARNADMPQRLPNGVRRTLNRLTPGWYLSEDGLLGPQPTLRIALEQAARADSRAEDRAVIDWDGEWAVMIRRFGPGGAPRYRLDRAVKRFLANRSRAAAP